MQSLAAVLTPEGPLGEEWVPEGSLGGALWALLKESRRRTGVQE